MKSIKSLLQALIRAVRSFKFERFFKFVKKNHIYWKLTGSVLGAIILFVLIYLPAVIENEDIIQLFTNKNQTEEYKKTEFDLFVPNIKIAVPVVADVDGYSRSEYKKALREGVAHFKDTAKPGEDGNIFIFGHSSSLGDGRYKVVFERLPELKEGDSIQLHYKNNDYYYAVTETKVVAYDDLSWTERGGEKVLTLMTCYPIGSSEKRLIIRARLK